MRPEAHVSWGPFWRECGGQGSRQQAMLGVRASGMAGHQDPASAYKAWCASVASSGAGWSGETGRGASHNQSCLVPATALCSSFHMTLRSHRGRNRSLERCKDVSVGWQSWHLNPSICDYQACIPCQGSNQKPGVGGWAETSPWNVSQDWSWCRR